MQSEALPELSNEEEIVGFVRIAGDGPKEGDFDDTFGLGTCRMPPVAGSFDAGAPLSERIKFG